MKKRFKRKKNGRKKTDERNSDKEFKTLKNDFFILNRKTETKEELKKKKQEKTNLEIRNQRINSIFFFKLNLLKAFAFPTGPNGQGSSPESVF